ncbi:hypothetical protein L9F63_015506, partial [Diploptera punctata]
LLTPALCVIENHMHSKTGERLLFPLALCVVDRPQLSRISLATIIHKNSFNEDI